MDPVHCQCKRCGTSLGILVNLWTRIGRTYVSPVRTAPSRLDIVSHGAVRLGDAATLVGQCRLQDVACKGCHEIVGLECLSTPTNHVLERNQILLRLSSVVILGAQTAEPVELSIMRSLTLREPAEPSTDRDNPLASSLTDSQPCCSPLPRADASDAASDGPDISSLQADMDTQRKDIDRLDTAGHQIVSAIDSAVGRIDHDVESLRDVVRHVQHNIGGHQDDLASLKSDLKDIRRLAQDSTAIIRLESQMRTTSDVLSGIQGDLGAVSGQLRKELQVAKAEVQLLTREMDALKSTSTASAAATKAHAAEMAVLRGEVAKLSRLLHQDRASKAPPVPTPTFPSRELDILTSNIAKIGNRASQVETLQMEFEILKGRVERMEDHDARREPRRLSVYSSNETAAADREQELYNTPDGPPSSEPRRKRPSSIVGVSSFAENAASKRIAFSSGGSGTPHHELETGVGWSDNSSPLAVAPDTGRRRKASGGRLTKTGTADRVPLKRGTRKSAR